MTNKYKTAVLFGTLHGINDFIAGFILSVLSLTSSNLKLNTTAFLLYSIIAFGGQLPAGIIVDKLKSIKWFSIFSIVCMIIAIALFYVNIFAAIFFSAIASAFIHVCGGAVCYLNDHKNISLAGIFASPGVVGLIFGGIIGAISFNYFYTIILLLIVLLYLLNRTAFPSYQKIEEYKQESILEIHDFFMLILLLAIAFRSLLWNVIHMMCFNNTNWLMAIAFAAFAGKLIGGYITNRVNWKTFVFISIISSAILLSIGKNNLPLVCIGVALLQSAIPITVVLMQQYMQKSPATATGLSLGISIILAGLPTYTNQFRLMQHQNNFWYFLCAIFIVSNFIMIRKAKKLA